MIRMRNLQVKTLLSYLGTIIAACGTTGIALKFTVYWNHWVYPRHNLPHHRNPLPHRTRCRRCIIKRQHNKQPCKDKCKHHNLRKED